MSLTKIGSIGINTGIQFAGVTTVSTLHVGSGVTLSSDGDIFATGVSTFSGNLKVGSGVTISPDGDGFYTGVVTATSYAGDGSALTGIDATQIVTGNTSVQTVDTGSDGHVKVNTEGSERLRVDSSGRLLIGTTTEGQSSGDDLTIATSGSTGITLRSATGNAGNILFSDGTSGDDEQRGIIQYHHSDNTMRLFTDATRRMTIDSSGRLLLGTTTEGAGDADDLTIATTGNTGLTLRSGTSGYASVFFSDGTSGVDEYRGYVQYGHSSNMMILGTDGVERVRIQSDGKFGINTNSPAEMLHVNGTTQSTDYKYTSHPGHSAFTGDNSTTGFTIQSGHSVNSILVTYNGVVLKPTTDYTVSGTTLTTTFTPLTSSEIVVRYLIK